MSLLARRPNRSRRRGAALVEFAVVSPILVSLVLGTIEVSRVLQVKQYLTDAARYGARAASRPGASNSDVQAAIKAVVANFNIPASAVTTAVKVNGTTADASTANSGD